ncbi:MAG: hypothetical protein ACTHJR_00735 [Sphingomonas sp.]|uniref:hypothetical protein n=1 Tax=Sphingomonas sp. TaxID=28214 RepID=UPI003F7F7C7D
MTDRDQQPSATDHRDDERSDLQQEAEARKDAVERGEGGAEPDTLTAPGLFSGNAGTGGETKNQDDDAQ